MTHVHHRFATRQTLVLSLLIVPTLAAAQTSSQDRFRDRKQAQAVRMAEDQSITLDGRLDEPAWQAALPIADFIQREPTNGAAATERTEVRILYDRGRLYLGVECFDSEPDRIISVQKQRDQNFDGDDRFMWSLDPYFDGRSGYSFTITPSGAMGDALLVVGQRGTAALNVAWDGIWNARVRRHDRGWTAEIVLPFRTINFDPDAPAWGANFQRTIRRKNEDALWSGWDLNQDLNRMGSAGALVGITGVSQGFGLDVKPYVLGRSAKLGENAPSTVTGQAGVDLFYSVTPQLKANFTVNTDFAETEVDDRQVNLTRFPLFFPERREFFLEGSSFFDFAREGGVGLIPFFSRRIGLTDKGLPQRIDYGVKLTGQSGAQDIGALQVRTGAEHDLLGEDFTVVRARRRLLSESLLGALYTRRSTRGSAIPDRHTAGVDMALETSKFRGNQNLLVAGFFLWTTNLEHNGGSTARGLRIDYPNERWDAQMTYREIQPSYSPAVGFLERRGYRRFHPQVTFRPRPRNNTLIRRYTFVVDLDNYTDNLNKGNALLERFWRLTPFGAEFQSGDLVTFRVFRRRELLENDFRVGGGILLPKGNTYDSTRYNVNARTAGQRMITANGTVEWGDFYSGRRRQYQIQLAVRPHPGLVATLSGDWNRVELAEGSFSTRVLRGVLNTQFSPWISLAQNIQYDTVSAVVGWQSRLRWIVKAGNDVYVVFGNDWVDTATGFVTVNRSLTSKINYTHRF